MYDKTQPPVTIENQYSVEDGLNQGGLTADSLTSPRHEACQPKPTDFNEDLNVRQSHSDCRQREKAPAGGKTREPRPDEVIVYITQGILIKSRCSGGKDVHLTAPYQMLFQRWF